MCTARCIFDPKSWFCAFYLITKKEIANAQVFVQKIYLKNVLCCFLLFASGKFLISQKFGDVIKSYTCKTT